MAAVLNAIPFDDDGVDIAEGLHESPFVAEDHIEAFEQFPPAYGAVERVPEAPGLLRNAQVIEDILGTRQYYTYLAVGIPPITLTYWNTYKPSDGHPITLELVFNLSAILIGVPAFVLAVRNATVASTFLGFAVIFPVLFKAFADDRRKRDNNFAPWFYDANHGVWVFPVVLRLGLLLQQFLSKLLLLLVIGQSMGIIFEVFRDTMVASFLTFWALFLTFIPLFSSINCLLGRILIPMYRQWFKFHHAAFMLLSEETILFGPQIGIYATLSVLLSKAFRSKQNVAVMGLGDQILFNMPLACVFVLLSQGLSMLQAAVVADPASRRLLPTPQRAV